MIGFSVYVTSIKLGIPGLETDITTHKASDTPNNVSSYFLMLVLTSIADEQGFNHMVSKKFYFYKHHGRAEYF